MDRPCRTRLSHWWMMVASMSYGWSWERIVTFHDDPSRCDYIAIRPFNPGSWRIGPMSYEQGTVSDIGGPTRTGIAPRLSAYHPTTEVAERLRQAIKEGSNLAKSAGYADA